MYPTWSPAIAKLVSSSEHGTSMSTALLFGDQTVAFQIATRPEQQPPEIVNARFPSTARPATIELALACWAGTSVASGVGAGSAIG